MQVLMKCSERWKPTTTRGVRLLLPELQPFRRRPGPAPEWRQRGRPQVYGGLCDLRVGVAPVQHGVLPAVHDHGRDAPDPEDRDRVLEEELEKGSRRGGGGVEGNDLVYFREGF